MANIHETPVRVYYEDTDAGGVVYYANYLRYAEHARADMLRELGYECSKLERDGVLIVVRHATADYRAPGRLDDLLTVKTRVVELRNSSFRLQQTVHKNDEILVDMDIQLVCVNDRMKPVRLPNTVRDAFAGAGYV